MNTPGELTERMQATFEPQHLVEKDIASYENYTYGPSQTDVSLMNQIVIEQNNTASDVGTDIYESFLLYKFVIKHKDGTAWATGASGTDENNFVHIQSALDFWKNIQIESAGQLVDQVTEPGKVQNMLFKTQMTSAWIEKNCHDMWYYPLDGETTNVGDNRATDIVENTLAKECADRLFDATTDAKAVWVRVPLKYTGLGISAVRKFSPFSKFTLKLDKDTSYNYILRLAGANVDHMIEIKQIKWICPGIKAKGSLAVNNMSKALVEQKPIPYDYFAYGYMRKDLQVGTDLQTVDLITTLKKCRHLFVGVQAKSYYSKQVYDATANAEVHGKGSYSLLDDEIVEMFVVHNGRQHPFTRYVGASEGYHKEVQNLKQNFGEDCPITTENFKSENCIYYFNLSNVDNLLSDNASESLIQINIRFKTGARVYSLHTVYLSEVHKALGLVNGVLTDKTLQY